jgi:outer membrane protein assembly factor BamB
MRAEGAVTVDLGTDWEPRDAPRPRGSTWRRVTAAGTALATVLVGMLGGSAASRPALMPVASIPTGITDTISLIGDHLFVLGRNGSRLDVYALPTGRHLWRLGFPAPVDTLRVDAAVGVLLVETFEVTRPEGTVTALELGTGRSLWQQPGGLVAALAQDVDGAALVAPADPSAAGQVRLVDVRTGAVRWSRAIAATTAFATAGPDRIIERSPSGDAQVVELSTGRVLASGLLGDPDPRAAKGLPPDPPTVPNVVTVGGLIFLLYQAEYPTTVVAYDGDTFRERWRVTEEGRVYWVAGCGPVLCAVGEQGVTGVDPATGAPRWRRTEWSGAYPIRDGSRAVVVGSTGESASALLDTATGAVALAIHGWAPVRLAADPMLVTFTEVGRLGVWVGVLDAVRARVSPLGWLSGIANLCEQDGPDPGHTYLACATPSGGTEVWRYRSD